MSGGGFVCRGVPAADHGRDASVAENYLQECRRVARALRGKTVAIDIETSGLSRERHDITVICMCGRDDKQNLLSITLNMLRLKHKKEELRTIVVDVLNAASRITTFNGLRFDFPFMQVAMHIPAKTVGAWAMKTFDVWEIAKNLCKATFKLDEVLLLNGFATKTANGAQAVLWANDPDCWDMLENYCMEDTRLTLLLSENPKILTPVKIEGGQYCIIQEHTAHGMQFSVAMHSSQESGTATIA